MNDISKQFENELRALLGKYGASIELEEDERSFSGSTYKMKVYAPTQYDNDRNIVQDCIGVDLGEYFSYN
jgi:hypothetical protein